MYLRALRLLLTSFMYVTISNCKVREVAGTCTDLTFVSCNSSTKQLWDQLSQLDDFFIASTLCPVEGEDCHVGSGHSQVSVINNASYATGEMADESPTRTLVRVPLNYVFHRTAPILPSPSLERALETLVDDHRVADATLIVLRLFLLLNLRETGSCDNNNMVGLALRDFGPSEVEAWLYQNNLQQFVRAFRSNDIDGETLLVCILGTEHVLCVTTSHNFTYWRVWLLLHVNRPSTWKTWPNLASGYASIRSDFYDWLLVMLPSTIFSLPLAVSMKTSSFHQTATVPHFQQQYCSGFRHNWTAGTQFRG